MDGLRDRHIDRQEDTTKLIVAFRNFANESNIFRSIAQCIYVFRKVFRADSYVATQHEEKGFIIEESVYCAVRPKCWNIIMVNLSLLSVNVFCAICW
jgi:hypothetical protein